jgi:WD40 repeat protein
MDSDTAAWRLTLWHLLFVLAVGHTEGITHLCPKGDGYHLISNSKDQTVKLWDVRKVLSPSAAIEQARQRPQIAHWDYRWEEYPGGLCVLLCLVWSRFAFLITCVLLEAL